MKSWQTTLFGLIAAVAAALAVTFPDTPVGQYSAYIACGAGAALGFLARDNSKSSEDVGLKPPIKPSVTALAQAIEIHKQIGEPSAAVENAPSPDRSKSIAELIADSSPPPSLRDTSPAKPGEGAETKA